MIGVAENERGSVLADMKARIAKICQLTAAREKKTEKKANNASTSTTSTSTTVHGVAGIVYCHKRDSCDDVAAQVIP